MENNFKSKRIFNYVESIKSGLFDIMTVKQRYMDAIEKKIGTDLTEEEELELQSLWAEFHEADKECIKCANIYTNALEKMDSCFSRYHKNKMGINDLSTEKVEENSDDSVMEESTQEEKPYEETMTEESTEAVTEPASEEVPMDAVVEVPVAETTEVVTEPVPEDVPMDAVVNVPVAETAEVVTEPVSEEVPMDAVVNVPVAETTEVVTEPASEEAPVDAVVNVPVAETTEVVTEPVPEDVPMDAVVNVPVAETTEVVTEPASEEAPVDAVVNVPVAETTEVVTEPASEEAPVDAVVNVPVAETAETVADPISQVAAIPTESVIDLPTETVENTSSTLEIPTGNMEMQNTVPQEPVIALPTAQDNAVNTATDAVVEVPTVDNQPASDSNTNIRLQFVKASNDEAKAILVSKEQKTKLIASYIEQRKQFDSLSLNKTVEEKVTPEKIEEMMNQLSTLYSEGKVEEAEKLSALIQELSQKLSEQ